MSPAGEQERPERQRPESPAGRPSRRRSLRESLGSIVLGFELIIVFLGALVVSGLGALSPAVALGGGAGVVLLTIVAIGLLRASVGVWLGWVVQLIVIAAGFLVPAFFIVGAIFTAMWTYCMIVSARLDRSPTETETP